MTGQQPTPPNHAQRKRSEAARKAAATRRAQKLAREQWERRQGEDEKICDGEFAGPAACVCGDPARHACSRPHAVVAAILYVSIRCGKCGETWDQPHTSPDDPGWNVCPYCLSAAPTEARDAS